MDVGRFCADPKELSRAISLLLATSARLKFFPHTHSVSVRKKYRDTDAQVGFSCEYHDCPLPPWCVPQLGCPFLLDEGDFVGGKYFAKGIADPVFQLLWDHAAATMSANFFVSIKMRFVQESGLATLNLTIRIDGCGKAKAVVDWRNGKELESPIAVFCSSAGFERYSLRSEFQSRRNAQRVYADIPHEALWEGIRSAVAGDAFNNHPLEIRAFVGHSIIEKGGISLYDQYRPLLNNISLEWRTQLDACYQDNFDVFRRPPEIPADCREIRYPVIAIPNKEHDGPKLQIDVVHRPSISSLEFHSTDGEAILKKAAKAAGVKLEMWEGPLHLRWRE